MATISKPKPDPVTSSEKIVGISQSGVAQIKAAIDKYIKTIQDAINVSANTANIEKAIKGSGSEANFKQASKDANAGLKAEINYLTKFKTSLDNILVNYQKQDASNTVFTEYVKNKTTGNYFYNAK